MNPHRKSALLLALAATAVSAHGATSIISWAYANGLAIPANDTAGVVAATNWNLTQQAGTSDLKYSDGTSSFTTISLAGGFGAWGIGGVAGADANGTYNKALFDGYYNDNDGSTLSLGAIPFAQYDIYVYFSSDTDNRTGTISDGTTTFSYSTIMRNQIDNTPSATFVQTTDTGSGNPGANYAVFSSLSGASQTLTIVPNNGGGIAGIQIVGVPEPSVAFLGVFGILGLLRRRR